MADFNPVKEDRDGVVAKRQIWTTKAIEAAIRGLNEGRKLVANPFYEYNTKLLKGDLVFKRTEEEIKEFAHCMNDILYFSNTFCQLMTPEGIQHIELRDYQEKYLQHLVNSQLSVYLACRQCGKTTTSALFLLWYALFNTDKNALVLGNKKKTAVEILDKIKKIYLEIPFFLKPGILKWNEGEIVFDNGCRIMAEATTINSGISFTFHCVLADEFAHVPVNILDKFYNNLFPTITAGKAKFIITSTQNGYNLFYRIYKAAVAGENDYKPFKTDWYEVPEWNPDTHTWDKRDEEWHRRQVANYGSEEAFNAQFGTNFDITANTLISVKYINSLRPRATSFETKDLLGVSNSDKFIWKPTYDPMTDLRKDYILVTVDISEGIGGDYTIFLFNKLTDTGLECIGMFRANDINIERCTTSLQELCMKYMNVDRLLISLETNLYGELFVKQLFANRDNIRDLNGFDESVLVKYYNDTKTKFTYGIKVSSGNKTINCKLFKEKFEHNEIVNHNDLFLLELENFCDNKGNDTYQASFGHDDIVMSQIQVIAAMQTIQYKFLREAYEEDANIIKEDVYNPYDVSDQDPYVQMSAVTSYEMYHKMVEENLLRLRNN